MNTREFGNELENDALEDGFSLCSTGFILGKPIELHLVPLGDHTVIADLEPTAPCTAFLRVA